MSQDLSDNDDITQPAVPILQEALSPDAGKVPVLSGDEQPATPALTQEQLASAQAELTSLTRELVDRLVYGAIRDMEATLFDKLADRLSEELPALIDSVLRDHLEPGD